MRGTRLAIVGIGAIVFFLMVSPIPSAASGATSAALPHSTVTSTEAGSSPPASGSRSAPTGASSTPTGGPVSFDERVDRTAAELAAAGVPARDIRLPYTGPAARTIAGTIEPGYAVEAQNVSPDYSGGPAPFGLAYYGENDTTGSVAATTLQASSVAGSLTVEQMDALYLDVDTPDMWGIQLNAVLGNVTLHGVPGYEFWVQNAVDVFQGNDTINLGEDTWNFSNPVAYLPSGTNTTILSHDPNGSIVGGLYIGEGPWLSAPPPFTLRLYVNSSLTAAGDQKLWYNYSFADHDGAHARGSYDWVVFNSVAGDGSPTAAPFVASGTQIDPVGLPNDFEFDYGIGGYNGATMDVLAANVSASLDYCPIALDPCSPSELVPVPAALDFGSETGETSSGMYQTFVGTTATAHAGPFVLRGLWGYSAAAGASPGAVAVRNAIKVVDAPVPVRTEPYLFAFVRTNSSFGDPNVWMPEAPVWYLAPGRYSYDLLLADYGEVSGTLVVGSSARALSASLQYRPGSGVYTPLWALSNGQLAGISSSGSGTVSRPFLLFDTPTFDCTACGGAPNQNLSPFFSAANDFGYPVFPGVLLDGTTAYTDLVRPASLCARGFEYRLLSPSESVRVCLYLQIQFYDTEHATLAYAAHVGGWPGLFETETLAGVVNASENPFPQAAVMIWGSSDDLVLGNTFVATPTFPSPYAPIAGAAPEMYCFECAPLDELLLYGGGQNTVWGNTFRDPRGPLGGGTETVFAGLAEAESGDRIYNNAFSVDNPTVYLPFDIYLDACPDGYAGDCGPLGPPAYADQWNISPEPASETSAVVNGFALRGSVLGGACPVQAGNYWDDLGNSLNPSNRMPFVNVYNYSEIVGILPNGSSANQASIRVGGDYAPLTPTVCSLARHAALAPVSPEARAGSDRTPGAASVGDRPSVASRPLASRGIAGIVRRPDGR